MSVHVTQEERRDFAARVAGTHPDEAAYRDYVLRELRLAHKRAKLLVLEIETIGVALRGGIVDADSAIVMLHEANALDFLGPTKLIKEETK